MRSVLLLRMYWRACELYYTRARNQHRKLYENIICATDTHTHIHAASVHFVPARLVTVYLCQRYVFEQFENCTIGMRSDSVAIVCASHLWENVPYHSSSVYERIVVRSVGNVDKCDGARSGRHRRIRMPSLLRYTHSNHSTAEPLSIHQRWGDRMPSTAIHITTIDELRRCDARALGSDRDRCYWMRRNCAIVLDERWEYTHFELFRSNFEFRTHTKTSVFAFVATWTRRFQMVCVFHCNLCERFCGCFCSFICLFINVRLV